MNTPTPDDFLDDIAEQFYAYTQPTPAEGFDSKRAYESLHHTVVTNPYSWRVYACDVPAGGDPTRWLPGRHESLISIVMVCLRNPFQGCAYINVDAIVAACEYWNQHYCQPALDAAEVRSTVQALAQAYWMSDEHVEEAPPTAPKLALVEPGHARRPASPIDEVEAPVIGVVAPTEV